MLLNQRKIISRCKSLDIWSLLEAKLLQMDYNTIIMGREKGSLGYQESSALHMWCTVVHHMVTTYGTETGSGSNHDRSWCHLHLSISLRGAPVTKRNGVPRYPPFHLLLGKRLETVPPTPPLEIACLWEICITAIRAGNSWPPANLAKQNFVHVVTRGGEKNLCLRSKHFHIQV